MPNNDWEKEFWKEFAHKPTVNAEYGFFISSPIELKKFISTLLAQTRQDTVREVIETMDRFHIDEWDNPKNQTIDFFIDNIVS